VSVDAERARWLIRWPESSSPAARLVCFGHAAAGASAFRTWSEVVPAHIEVSAVRLPGRESRLREAPIDDIHELVAAALPALVDALEPPYALFGHCSGGLVAFELARALAGAGHPAPVLLAVASQVAPSAHAIPPEARALDLRARLELMGAGEDAIMSNDQLFAALEPAIAADFRLVDRYVYRPGPRLGCPLAVFIGSRQETAEDLAVPAWAGETAAGCDVRLLEAGHFFRGEAWGELALAVSYEVELRADEWEE
jgi:medium-chain acyl-[acyl-carrier-protein] hydrolase